MGAGQNAKMSKYTQQVVRDAADAARHLGDAIAMQRKVRMPPGHVGVSSVSPMLALLASPPKAKQLSEEQQCQRRRHAVYRLFLEMDTADRCCEQGSKAFAKGDSCVIL